MKIILTMFRRTGRLAPVLLALAALATVMAPACSSSDAGSGAAAAQACKQNSDCASGLICALGACRAVCKTSSDCPTGGQCIDNGEQAICQYAAERNMPCQKPSDCQMPLACASDYRCRNLCTTAGDCNVLGITGRDCAKDANGVFYCADPPEVTGDNLTAAPPPGAPDSGVIEPNLSTSGNDGGNSSGSDGGNSSGSDGGNSSGNDGGNSSGNDGGNSSGSDSGASCSPVCSPGYQCVSGSCVVCGAAAGDPCCGSTCGPNLSCSGGTCACGTPGIVCCGGSTCSGGVTCVSGTCACGAAGQACCPAGTISDAASAACNGALQCHGGQCTCIIAAHDTLQQRSDGSLWNGGSNPVQKIDASLFIATSFSAFYGGYCGVQSDGTLWCGNYSGTGNPDGALGNGTTMGSTYPSQVVTAAAGPALIGITNVFSDTSGYTSCAINASGSLWCWGNNSSGMLGNGSTASSSNFAVPVLTASGGAQFTGVASVSIGYGDQVCAVKTDSSLWCWGNNSTGQLGLGTTTTQYPYPTQVTALYNTVVNVAAGQGTCATTTDGSVWCWGTDQFGQLGNGLTTGQALVPVKVKAAPDAGAPFSGISLVQTGLNGGNYVAEKASDGSLWVWGYNSTASPEPLLQGGSPVTNVFQLVDGNTTQGAYIASDGSFYYAGNKVTSPSCP